MIATPVFICPIAGFYSSVVPWQTQKYYGTDCPFLLKILFQTTSAVNRTKLQTIVDDPSKSDEWSETIKDQLKMIVTTVFIESICLIAGFYIKKKLGPWLL